MPNLYVEKLEKSLTMEECFPYREALVQGSKLEHFKAVVVDVEKHFVPYMQGLKTWTPPSDHPTSRLPFPPWQCQVSPIPNYGDLWFLFIIFIF